MDLKPALAQILDNNGRLIAGTEQIVPGPSVTFDGLQLRNADFRGLDLTNSSFVDSRLGRANFTNANLTGANLRDAYLEFTDLSNAILDNAIIEGAGLFSVDGLTPELLASTASYRDRSLRGVTLDQIRSSANGTMLDLTNFDLTDASFSRISLEGVSLQGSVIDGTSFGSSLASFDQLTETASYQQKTLRGVQWHGFNLVDHDFSGFVLENVRFGRSILTGANFNNATLEGTFIPSDINGASFREANLQGANLSEVNLSEVDLTDAIIDGVSFPRSFSLDDIAETASLKNGTLREVYFPWNTNLNGMDFSGLDMTGARFDTLNLNEINFRNATLTGVELLRGRMSNADFQGADLTGANLTGSFGHVVNNATIRDASIHLNVEQLVSTASYQEKDLRGWNSLNGNMPNVDLSGQNLTGASLGGIEGADLTNAVIKDVTFRWFRQPTIEQLRSTKSYADRDLGGIVTQGAPLDGAEFNDVSFIEASLTSASLKNAQLQRANLTNANLQDADLTDADLANAIIVGTNLANSKLSASQLASTQSFIDGNLQNAQLGSLELQEINFNGFDLSGATFSNTQLQNADFGDANLTGAAFVGAQLAEANLGSANLTEAQLSNGQLQNAILTGANLTGAELSGAQLMEANLTGANLTDAVLEQAQLRDANLTSANLTGANFRNAQLARVTLNDTIIAGADLGGTGISFEQLASTKSFIDRDLRGIRLSNADLTERDLSGQNLSGAVLDRVTLNLANLENAVLDGANVGGASFVGSNLTLQQLQQTSSWSDGVLDNIWFDGLDLTGIDLTGKSLDRTSFRDANLTGATIAAVDSTEFAGATIRGAQIQLNGLTEDQLASTADYSSGELLDIGFSNVPGWDLSGQKLTDSSFHSRDLRGTDFTNADLTGVDFTDAQVGGAVFTGSNMTFAQLSTTDALTSGSLDGFVLDGLPLRGGDFSNRELSRASFSGSDLTDADFENSELFNADFSEATLTNTNFANASVYGASFRNTTGSGFVAPQLYQTRQYQRQQVFRVDLSENDLSGWDFSNQRLIGSSFADADLTNANFSGARISESSFANSTGFTVAQLTTTQSYADGKLQGMDFTGLNFDAVDFTRMSLPFTVFNSASLIGVRFDEANLLNVDFSDANLEGSTLTGARINGTVFTNTNLTNADLRDGIYSNINLAGANITGAQFSGSEFRSATLGASLQGIDLSNTRFIQSTLEGSDLRAANLQDAYFEDSSLANVDLRGANLEGMSWIRPISFANAQITPEQIRSTANYQGAETDTGTIRHLQGVDFTGVDLTGLDLSNAQLFDSTLAGTNLLDVNLENARIIRATFNGATNLTQGQLRATQDYSSGVLANVGLQNLDMRGWELADVTLTGVDFSGSQLQGSVLRELREPEDLQNGTVTANFNEANLTGATIESSVALPNATFDNTVITDATIAFPMNSFMQLRETWNFRNQDMRGVKLQNESIVLPSADYSTFDFTGAQLGIDLRRQRLRGADLTSVSLQGALLSFTDFRGANLTGVDFTDVNMQNTQLADANLTDAIITGVLLPNPFSTEQLSSTANFKNGNLAGVNFGNNTFEGIDLSGKDLSDAVLTSTRLRNANLAGANLTNAMINVGRIDDSNVEGANITGAQLSSVNGAFLSQTRNFVEKNLAGTVLSGSLSELELNGFDITNADWRGLTLLDSVTVAGADFSNSELPRMTEEQLQSTANWVTDSWAGVRFNSSPSPVDLSGRNLAGASFEGLSLTNHTFDDADISGVSFAGAGDIQAIATSANFRDGSLRDVDLSQINYRPSFDFRDIDLTGTSFGNSRFIRSDLRGTTGLDVEAPDVTFEQSILPDGTLTQLDRRGVRYEVRNHPIPVRINGSSITSIRMDFLLDSEEFVPVVVEQFNNPIDVNAIRFEGDVHIADWYGRDIQLFDFMGGAVPPRFFGDFRETLIWDASRLDTEGIVVLTGDRRLDVTRNGSTDAGDINRLCNDIRRGRSSSGSDVNGDSEVDLADLELFWSLSGVLPADFDLDGTVGIRDFLELSRNFGDSRTFGSGNADCIGGIDVGDFLLLSRHFGETADYVIDWNGSSAAAAVPEPEFVRWAIVCFLTLLRVGRSRSRNR